MSRTLQAVATFEALKGVVVVLASSAVLSLAHKDLHALALSLVEHTHLNPAAKYPQIFLSAANDLHNAHLLMLALGAAAYSLLRFVEAYGLYRERVWAEMLAAVSGAIYVPFEVLALWRTPTWLHGALLALNLGVVTIMVGALLRRRSGALQASA
ncbi:MAG: DUF2127 domain-containing protein [Comamonadaceae bacterium]|nr:MAG: DUF2127 domain-containing protein [Comamonadaceae bacterium]